MSLKKVLLSWPGSWVFVMEESGEEERKRNGSRVKKTLQRGLLMRVQCMREGKYWTECWIIGYEAVTRSFPQDNWKFWIKSLKPSCAGNEASTQNSEQKLEQDVPGCQTANKVANQPPEIVSEKAAATAAKSLQPYLTLQPHRRQSTRLPRPQDSPGKDRSQMYTRAWG